jgi:chromate reductase, NAD(P)H dehydrogenase (quinone)
MPQATLVGLCGSLRAESFNRKLMQEAGRRFETTHGGRFVEGDLRLPLFDADLEARGMPDAVTELADRVRGADAVLIACPEYNKAPPGVMKNALDWLSRFKDWPMEGKPAALVSATAGRAGGERTQFILRLMLVPHRAQVLTHPEVLVGQAKEHFDAEGRLATDSYAQRLDEMLARLHDAVSAAA